MEISKNIKDSMITTCIIKILCTGISSVLATGYGLFLFYAIWITDSMLAIGGLNRGIDYYLEEDFLFLFILPIVYVMVPIHLLFITCVKDMNKIKLHLVFIFIEELLCMVASYITFTFWGIDDVTLAILQFCFLTSTVAGFVLNIRNVKLVSLAIRETE